MARGKEARGRLVGKSNKEIRESRGKGGEELHKTKNDIYALFFFFFLALVRQKWCCLDRSSQGNCDLNRLCSFFSLHQERNSSREDGKSVVRWSFLSSLCNANTRPSDGPDRSVFNYTELTLMDSFFCRGG